MKPEGTNGNWEILWKLNQILLPIVIAWAVWATVSIFEGKAWRNEGPRYTQKDADKMRLEIQQWTIANFPTYQIQVDINNIKTDVAEIKAEVKKRR